MICHLSTRHSLESQQTTAILKRQHPSYTSSSQERTTRTRLWSISQPNSLRYLPWTGARWTHRGGRSVKAVELSLKNLKSSSQCIQTGCSRRKKTLSWMRFSMQRSITIIHSSRNTTRRKSQTWSSIPSSRSHVLMPISTLLVMRRSHWRVSWKRGEPSITSDKSRTTGGYRLSTSEATWLTAGTMLRWSFTSRVSHSRSLCAVSNMTLLVFHESRKRR